MGEGLGAHGWDGLRSGLGRHCPVFLLSGGGFPGIILVWLAMFRDAECPQEKSSCPGGTLCLEGGRGEQEDPLGPAESSLFQQEFSCGQVPSDLDQALPFRPCCNMRQLQEVTFKIVF